MKKVIDVGVVIVLCLSFFYLRFNIVMSGSMEPFISTGSLVVVNTLDHTVNIGDIILYQKQKMKILHRVVEVKEDSYITKGDANEVVDQNPVLKQQVIGKYVMNIPYFGYILFYCIRYLWVLLMILIFWRMKR